MTNKRSRGQFFTTNAGYILSGFSEYIKDKNISDPFAGNKDLINWAIKNGAKTVKGFDVDAQYIDNKIVYCNDSIKNSKKYDFILTNPPYLHKNKADIQVKKKYFSGGNSIFEDLYQISISSILNSKEGIMILPLNFLSAENSDRIRRIFFNKFEILKLNIFSHQVFEDTTYNVISFYYRRKKNMALRNIIKAIIFPEKQKANFILEEKYGWQLGGEFHSKINLEDNRLGIYRLTESHLKKGDCEVKLAFNNIKNHQDRKVSVDTCNLLNNNILFLRAIDSKNGKKIGLEDIRQYGVKALAGKQTSRNMASLLLPEYLDMDTQEKIVDVFNKELAEARGKHLSLFLTNFRDNNRKRISFEFAYKLINYVYFSEIKSSSNSQKSFNFNNNFIKSTI